MLLYIQYFYFMENAISTLVGEELEGCYKWKGTMAAPNGSVYGIPYHARRIAKFNPVDKSMTHIGPDFGGGIKWNNGAINDRGIIYCVPYDSHRGILKIDTNTDNVTELNRKLLPEQGRGMLWKSCAAALDGCIYFMPHFARYIMKLDPNNNDAMSSVGDDLGDGWKYSGTVVGIDGCVYGIPYHPKHIVKYDPINDITSFVGEEADEDFRCNIDFGCNSNGVLGRDGCIYALAKDGRVLKIDTTNNRHGFVGNSVGWGNYYQYWGDAILGIDGCVYWPPNTTTRTLKYDPHTDLTSLVGCDLGTKASKWLTGALTTDGVIYCIPFSADQVLAIDPLGEFLETTKANMENDPKTFGSLFQKITEVGEGSALVGSQTNFDHAIVRFGQKQVCKVLEKALKPVNDYCKQTNLCPFMIVASYKETNTFSAMHHLLRYDLSWVNKLHQQRTTRLESKIPTDKKRKRNSVK